MTRLATIQVALAMVLVSGCAATSGLAPTSTKSGFDGARVVDIQAHGGACAGVICPGLGAQWSDKSPTVAILTVAVFNDIKAITGAQLAIDGRVLALQPMPGLTNFSRPGDPLKQSRRDFTARIEDVRAMAAAQRAWLRVITTDGALEVAIVDGSTDSKALHAMRRFLAEIDGANPTR